MPASPTPFPAVAPTARGHLSLRVYEVVLALQCYDEACAARGGAAPARLLDAHPFLAGYTAELATHDFAGGSPGAQLRAYRERVAAWERAAEAWLPLRALAHELRLDPGSLLALVLAGIIEEDPRFGAVYADAQGGAARPTIALLHALVAATGCSAHADAWSLCRPLLDAGLVDVLNAADPRAQWQLRVPMPLWAALAGDAPARPLAGVQWRPADDWAQLHHLVLDDADHDRLRAAQVLLAAGEAAALVVRGLAGSERVETIGAVARGLGRGVLEVGAAAGAPTEAWRLLGPLATLLGGMPVFVLDLGPGDVFTLPECAGYAGPVGVVVGRDGGLNGAAAERAVTVHLPPEAVGLRRRHWARAFPGAAPAVHDALAATYTLGGRYISRAATLAAAHAAMEGRTTVMAGDVRAAARSINRQELDALATHLSPGGGWDSLILHPGSMGELRHLEERCRHRETLTAALGDGLPGGMNRGVRALLQGPSGTGKTLAARVLAAELGLDLYRVDLSAVISKYIGETEKNLSRVFARAEDLDVILLLDEGDSLMGRRTQVRSSHDRWANMETNYLLQRLETYTGIVLITTNLPGAMDVAFRRRMDVVVRFHPPASEERWQLWQRHLPADHDIDAETVEDAAVRYELTGGQIRNAAVDAALLGLVGPDGRLRREDFVAAVQAEYRKAGAALPRESASRQGGEGTLAAFLGAIR